MLTSGWHGMAVVGGRVYGTVIYFSSSTFCGVTKIYELNISSWGMNL